MTTLRTQLREATSASHELIEKNPRLSLLTSPSLSEVDYRNILERYYGFFRPLENTLRASSLAKSVVPDLLERFKSNELTEDLLALGLTAQEIEELEFCSALPALNTAAEILGVLYVTEGSALGGLMIAKHLSTLSFYSSARGSFFHADGPGVSARWKSYLISLESLPSSDWPAVISSALRTFEALDHWMAAV